MKWFGSKATETKANPTGGAYVVTNNLNFTPRIDPRKQLEEGYQKNSIVYRCINEITTAIANLDIEVYKNGKEVEDHYLDKMLERPNPTEGYDDFIKGVFTDFLSTGEMFISGVKIGGKTKELWRQSPVHMTVIGSETGMVGKYVFKNAGKEITFPVDQLTGESELFFKKMPNPLNYWRGQSPLQAAALAVDSHNAGMIWNNSLLENSARPSGIIELTGTPSSETVGRFRELFKKRIQGKKNAGEIPMLIEGAKWVPTDTNPRDMDFISTLKETTKYIASTYGVPLPLVDNDSASYNNIEQAKERFYTDTVIPLFNSFLRDLNNWLRKELAGAEFCINMDSIPALEKMRQIKFDRMLSGVEKGVISIDEARQELGYEPIGGVAASLLIPQGKIPLDMAGFDGMTPDEQNTAKQLRRANFTDIEIRQMLEQDRHAACTHS